MNQTFNTFYTLLIQSIQPLNHAFVFVCFGFAVFKEMLQTPENSAFNKNRSRKLSGNNLTGGKNQGEYSTTAEPKQKPSTLLRPGKAGNLSVSKRITLMFTGKVKFMSHRYSG